MGLIIGSGITVNGAVQIVFEDPAVPTNLIPPSLNGIAVSGNEMSVTNGDWTGVPYQFTYTYQWQLNSSNVVGATANTFTLTDSMVGQTVGAIVTATNASGSTSASSSTQTVSSWGPGQWTVSNTGISIGTTVFDSTDNYIWRTTSSTILSRTQDGATWGNVTIPITAPSHVLQADNRIVIWKSGTNNAAYSTNEGTTWAWSNINVNTTTNLGPGAFDGANIVIIRGDPASNSFVRSTDLGTTWSNVDTGSYTTYTRDITYGNGVFMTVGDYSNGVINTSKISSDGGVTWTPVSWVKGLSIAYGAGRFVTTYTYGANSNPAMAYSTTDNGASWTGTRLPDQGWDSIVFADTHFVISESGGNIMYSEDGISWYGPYRTITTLQAGSGTMAYLPSHDLLLNGGGGYYVTHTQVPSNPTPNPTQPTNVNASSLNSTQASLTWTAPAYDGGSAILNYTIQAIGVDGAANVTQNTSGPVTSYTFTGLVTGKSYYFTVAAVNSLGTGPSTPSEQTVQIVPIIGETYGGGVVIKVGPFSATICSNMGGDNGGTWSASQSFCLGYTQNGYSDWLMPGLTDMDAMYTNRALIGGYTNNWYWTSTAYNPAMPGTYWVVNMANGAHATSSFSSSVRAIRTQFY